MSSYFIGDTTVYTTVSGASLVGTDRLPIVIAAGGGTYGVLHQILVSELLTVFQPYSSHLARIAAMPDPDFGTGTGTGSAGSESPLLYWDNVSSQFNWLDLGYGLMVSGSTLVLDPTAAKSTLGLVIGTDVQAYDATLTALAGQNWAANSLPVGSGSDTVAQVTFTANTFPARASTGNLVAKTITDFGLSLVDDADASAGRTTLGLGTASVKDTGTSGATVPLLNGANTWSAAQTLVAASAAGKPLVVQGAASQTASLAEFQSSTGTAFVTVGPPTLPADGSQNFFNVTGTFNASASGTQTGAKVATTFANANVAQRALTVTVPFSGGTHSAYRMGVFVDSGSAGGGLGALSSGAANYGMFTQQYSDATTTGHNVGFGCYVDGSTSLNVGVAGHARVGNATNTTSVGVIGTVMITDAGTKYLGGYFSLSVSVPTFASAALMCDNGTAAADIFVARDNGTAVFTIADGGVVSFTALESLWVPAAAMRPSASGGCASLATIATSANRPDVSTLDFDQETEEYCQFTVAMPKRWDEGTLQFQFLWSHAAATTAYDVTWGVQGVAVSDGETIDVAFGTAVEVTDTGGNANYVYQSARTSAMTVAGSPAAEDLVCFRVYRKATVGTGTDSLHVDARLHGVRMFYTTNIRTDA